jgi:hypothetical protein
VHDDRVPAFVVLVADVQRLVHVTDEVRQEHEALRQVIWLHMRMFRNFRWSYLLPAKLDRVLTCAANSSANTCTMSSGRSCRAVWCSC